MTKCRSFLHRGAPALAAAAVAAVLAAGPPAAAQTYCTKPIEPLCVQQQDMVQSAPDETLCIEGLVSFEEGLREYAECLGEARQRAESTIEAIGSFRSCLEQEGYGNCPQPER